MRLHSGWDHSLRSHKFKCVWLFGIMWDFIGLSNLKSIWMVNGFLLLIEMHTADRRGRYHRVSFMLKISVVVGNGFVERLIGCAANELRLMPNEEIRVPTKSIPLFQN